MQRLDRCRSGYARCQNLWLWLMDDAIRWRKIHGWLTLVWFTQFPLVLFIRPDLQNSVRYLVIISIAAAALGQMSSWQAARVEVKQDEAAIELAKK